MTQPTQFVSRARVTVPVALTAIAAAAVSLAPVIGVVRSSDGSAVGGPGTAAALASALVWILVAIVALFALARGRTLLAGAVVTAVGAMSLGMAVADLQLFVSAIDADRLELFRPVTAAELSPGPGSVAVVLGHLVVVAAGVLAMVAASRSDDAPFDDGRPASASAVALGIAGALAVAASFVLPSFVSSDPVFLAPALVAGPILLAVGGALCAVTALVACAVALTSSSREVAAGVLAGTALAAASVALVRVVGAGGAGDRIGIAPGPVVGVVGVLALALAALVVARSGGAVESAAPRAARTAGSTSRRHMIAGAATVLTGLVLGASALLPLLTAPDGRQPAVAGERPVLLFALVTVVVGVVLFFSEFASAVRPAAALIVLGHIALSFAVLQAVVLGVGIDGVGIGSGGWLLLLGVATGVLAVIAIGVAGASERDGVDTSDLDPAARGVAVAAGIAAAVSVVGLLLPVYDIDGDTAGWIGSLPWGWDVWGRLTLAVAVGVAAVIATRARPARGAALEVGAGIALAAVVCSALVGDADAAITPSSGALVCGVGAVASALVGGLLFRTGE
ncbi:hypothetical protein ASG56_03915 [Rhodococcus sp. Leaf7]|uniref:hypothetical protein n=1 Tax=unclassified Rhodococcus (in: high G+C Gram-positive bacteria) TaxID=192944 RepID=UPI0006F6916D|nr:MULTISPECIES: hypothetical protein [unclassified Rhodococcus (in: high G+C Gram-positive bacteria)]KQU06773.1 hypothetical protein ASG56_03915 [Rhodococcus sp. Leaf7]KQU42292.1 hypothetical protein ASG64_03915 [Rhodococcus sp. Leaf247]